jgi:hypothetical protein
MKVKITQSCKLATKASEPILHFNEGQECDVPDSVGVELLKFSYCQKMEEKKLEPEIENKMEKVKVKNK